MTARHSDRPRGPSCRRRSEWSGWSDYKKEEGRSRGCSLSLPGRDARGARARSREPDHPDHVDHRRRDGPRCVPGWRRGTLTGPCPDPDHSTLGSRPAPPQLGVGSAAVSQRRLTSRPGRAHATHRSRGSGGGCGTLLDSACSPDALSWPSWGMGRSARPRHRTNLSGWRPAPGDPRIAFKGNSDELWMTWLWGAQIQGNMRAAAGPDSCARVAAYSSVTAH